jgi:hypothetical protein
VAAAGVVELDEDESDLLLPESDLLLLESDLFEPLSLEELESLDDEDGDLAVPEAALEDSERASLR